MICHERQSHRSAAVREAMLLMGRRRRVAGSGDTRILHPSRVQSWIALPSAQGSLGLLEAALRVELRDPGLAAVVPGRDPHLHRPRYILEADIPRAAGVA